MAASKRLKNADGVRGTHSKGNGPGPSGQALQTFVGQATTVALRLAQKVTNRHTPEQTAANYASGTDTDAKDSTGKVNYGFRDVRDNKVQVLTLTAYDGTDTMKIQVEGRGKTAAFVRGTNATAAAIQAELRTLCDDDTLTVSGTTDEGPFTVTFLNHVSRELTVTDMTASDSAVTTTTPTRAIDALGETALPVIVVSATDTSGPAAGGIDVNYTIGSYTGVHVVLTTNGDPQDVIYDGYESSSTPLRIEAADFIDGVGPGSGVAVDVYVQGYLTTDPAANAAYSTFGPWAAKVDGTTA